MTDLRSRLNNLQRPRLLIAAARHGQSDYLRHRDLPRLLDSSSPPPRDAVRSLLEEEARIEASRRSDAPGYSFSRHIELLVALMAEARCLPQEAP